MLLSSQLHENGEFLEQLGNCQLLNFPKRVRFVSMTLVWQSFCRQKTEFANGSVEGVHGYLCVTMNY